MPTALAIAAHPDDIEFVMAGTLLLKNPPAGYRPAIPGTLWLTLLGNN